MRSAQAAFRASLVALAAALAALLAHLTIDWAGDFLLPHDTYDGIAHESRAVFVVAIAALAIAIGARLLFDLLGRKSSSTASLLRSLRGGLGAPAIFVAQAAGLAVVVLAGMEFFDCAAAGTPADDVSDLFGGSLALGLSVTLATGAVAGWAVHALARLLAAHEPAIAALVFRLIGAIRTSFTGVAASVQRRRASRTIVRALLLARRGSKRGPPLPIPG